MLMSSARRADRNGRVPVNCLMTVQQLFQSGQLDEALKALTAEVRDNPTDPKRRTFLFELLWLPATVRTSAAFQGRELGEVLLPVLNPFSWRSADPAIRLGRATAWEEEGSEEAVPKGQKLLLADDKEWPLLELRDIEFVVAQAAS